MLLHDHRLVSMTTAAEKVQTAIQKRAEFFLWTQRICHVLEDTFHFHSALQSEIQLVLLSLRPESWIGITARRLCCLLRYLCAYRDCQHRSWVRRKFRYPRNGRIGKWKCKTSPLWWSTGAAKCVCMCLMCVRGSRGYRWQIKPKETGGNRKKQQKGKDDKRDD